jgi:hypothetical protein
MHPAVSRRAAEGSEPGKASTAIPSTPATLTWPTTVPRSPTNSTPCPELPHNPGPQGFGSLGGAPADRHRPVPA